MQEHTLSAFDAQLRALDEEIARMAALARAAAAEATRALLAGDAAAAQVVIAGDREIDARQSAIEQLAVVTIARNQPMAVDLREIVAALRIANDLERIGDLAKNVAKRTVAIGDVPRRAELMTGIAQLSKRVEIQLEAVIAAWRARDDDQAAEIRRRDRDIDALHTSVFRDLLTYMLEDPRNIQICAHLLFCAKNIERIGDHATNIAETIHYIRTGEIMDDDRPKADDSSGPITRD